MQTRIVIATDKFRGTATAIEASEALAAGFRAEGFEGHIDYAPIADGGEGTVEAFINSGFQKITTSARTALGQVDQVFYAQHRDIAVIEAAAVTGWNHTTPSSTSALRSSSFGVGDLIRDALARGSKRIIIGVGGTASTDGGRGMLEALGARFLEGSNGTLLVDATPIHELLGDCEVQVATDVDNPLLGSNGAAYAFGPQKGATPADIEILEKRISLIANALDPGGNKYVEQKGAGAGGGIAFALMAAVGAKRHSGADLVLDTINIDALFQRNPALVVTGEGKLDSTSLHGKGAVAVARRATKWSLPTHAVVGMSTLSQAEITLSGFAEVHDLSHLAGSEAEAKTHVLHWLKVAGSKIARSLTEDHK